jgi:tRNA nucleotidyltransferase (CCA-adding enzyme)
MLTNTELRYYDAEVLRLPRDKRSEYHAQVDRLVATLSAAVKDKTKIKITRVVKAGSFAKFTILRKTADDPVDVDVVFYVSGRNFEAASFEGLSSDIYDLLVELYPTKSVEDFEVQKRAATVVFKGTGLAVDIVPVVEILGKDGHGYQFDTGGGRTLTCAPCQIGFVKKRKDADGDYRTLVRLMKKWRNYHEVSGLKSFHVELILAHLQDQHGPCDRIEQRLRDFFLYVAQTELKSPIRFPENTGLVPAFKDPVVIVDPVNNENNTAARITEAERKAIVAKATEAWEIANFASVEDDPALWKELFGPRFKTKD